MRWILTFAEWTALGVILAAMAWGDPVAERFIGAAGVWALVINLFAVLALAGLMFSEAARVKHREASAKRGWLDKSFGLVNSLVGLAVYAYAGWLVTFGIRLVAILIFKAMAQEGGARAPVEPHVPREFFDPCNYYAKRRAAAAEARARGTP